MSGKNREVATQSKDATTEIAVSAEQHAEMMGFFAATDNAQMVWDVQTNDYIDFELGVETIVICQGIVTGHDYQNKTNGQPTPIKNGAVSFFTREGESRRSQDAVIVRTIKNRDVGKYPFPFGVKIINKGKVKSAAGKEYNSYDIAFMEPKKP